MPVKLSTTTWIALAVVAYVLLAPKSKPQIPYYLARPE